jgi:conjugal transfer mating pair stabilization protein TraN
VSARFRASFACVLMILCATSASGQTTQAEAFRDGKAYSRANADIRSRINSDAVTLVPGQDPESANSLKDLYGSDLRKKGDAKAATCSSYVAGADAYRDQDCDVTNYVGDNRNSRPRFAINRENDPLMTRSAGVRSSPREHVNGASGLSGTYSPCTATSTKQSNLVDCSNQTFCIAGNCFDTGSAPDPDFARVVSAMEAAREAGVYFDDRTFQVFKGQDNRCSKTSVSNCCKETSKTIDGLSNLAVAGGSAYAFDVLGGREMKSSIAFGFDPTTFALATSVMVAREMLACDRDEVLVAVKREHRLCHYVGQYCSNSIRLGLGRICIRHKETHCCFNSKISRMINEAARVQLRGLDWGTAESPSCAGLTLAQFQSMDLSTVDFSEFYVDIKPEDPNQEAILHRATEKVNSTLGK